MLTFASWTAALSTRGFAVLPTSHAVPVALRLRRGADLLDFSARGTTLRLRRYDAAALTTLLLRAECDCEEHRLAGATPRLVLAPGARPTTEAIHDGALLHGWTGHQAAMLPLAQTAGIFEALLARLEATVPLGLSA